MSEIGRFHFRLYQRHERQLGTPTAPSDNFHFVVAELWTLLCAALGCFLLWNEGL